MTKTKKIAIISDIHGNSWALNEVLADIKSKGIDTIINLGDSLYGPLDTKGTYELITNNNIISVSGNQDKFIIDNLDCKSDNITLEYVKSQINPEIIVWLKTLKFSLDIDNDIYCCHASPQSDSKYLLERLLPDSIAIKTNDEIDNLLIAIKQRIILCGHSHIPMILVTDSKTIINPGSVGLQAYDDELPIPHKMENFNNLAHYSIIRFIDDLIKIDQIAISYDYEAAAIMAAKNNRKDWAKWIKTGRAE